MRWNLVRHVVGLGLAFGLTCGAPAASAASTTGPAEFDVKRQRNVVITLDDGRVLRADIYSPTDKVTGRPAPGPFPVLLGFTPYGKSSSAALKPRTKGVNGLNFDLIERGYIGAVVDIPGTGGSTGRFTLFDEEEAQAGKEVVDWSAKLPRSTGTVGMLGQSYLGINQFATAAAVGPGSPLRAIFPMAVGADLYRDVMVSGGALNTISPLGLLAGFAGIRTLTPFQELAGDLPFAIKRSGENLGQLARVESPVAVDWFKNGPKRYDGKYWSTRSPQNKLQQVVDNGVAAYVVGGLYDIFQRGEPLLYSGLQNAAAGRPVTAPMEPGQPVSGKYQMLTGPWNHLEIGDGVDLSAIQLAWFDRWLKDEDAGIETTTNPLHVVEPGGRSYDTATYPLSEARVDRLWLRQGRALSTEAPTGPEPADRIDYTVVGTGCSRSLDQFAAGVLNRLLKQYKCLSDTRKPVNGRGETTYSTEPLAADMQLGGPIGVTLRSTSTARDTLFALTVEDVAPSGRSEDVTGGAQLGSLRAVDPARSWPSSDGSWLIPHHPLTRESARPVPRGGVVTRYDIEVRPAFTTIPKGHRLRLRIATSDFPHFITLADLPRLYGGVYGIRHDVAEPSFIDVSVRPN